VRAAGVGIALAGLALAVRSALLLGGRGRPRRGPRPAFILAGPYLRMRNPLLAEPALRNQFGAAYDEYLRRVPRWVPRRDAPSEDAGA